MAGGDSEGRHTARQGNMPRGGVVAETDSKTDLNTDDVNVTVSIGTKSKVVPAIKVNIGRNASIKADEMISKADAATEAQSESAIGLSPAADIQRRNAEEGCLA